MTTSEYGTEGVDDSVLGVLTGQVPVRSMPIAGYENTQAAKDEDPDWTDRDGSE